MCTTIESANLEQLEQALPSYEREAAMELEGHGRPSGHMATMVTLIKQMIVQRKAEQAEIEIGLAADRARRLRLEIERAQRVATPLSQPSHARELVAV